MLVLLAGTVGLLVERPPPRVGLLERMTSPRLVNPADGQHTQVIRWASFLSDVEIDALHAAAASVRASSGEVSRDNGLREASWLTVFLNHRLRHLLPQFHAKLFAAARETDANHWGLLDASRHALNLRCAEYHTVLEQGGLPMTNHIDQGSLITMDIMLSDTADFEGGEFQTPEADGSVLTHRFERGDLLVFNSHKYHRVSPLTGGTRNVFVCEVWEGLERKCPRRCTEPWGACYCQWKKTDLYLPNETGGQPKQCPLMRSES